MARTDSTGSTWRYRWARRQNERRLRLFRSDEETWRRRDDELRRLRTLAEQCHGSAAAGHGLPLELNPDELVLRVVPAAQLVDVRHIAVLPAPELTVDPQGGRLRHRPPDGVRVTDAGMAVITNRRLVLLGGRGRRDWAYGRMTGLVHDPQAPVTLIQVLDRRRISGVLLPVDAAAEFRFVLTLAFADAIEQRAAVIAQLDELTAEHAANRPTRPGIATPGQARLSALIPGGRRTAVVAAGLAVTVPLVLANVGPSDPAGREVAVAATPAPAVSVTATKAARTSGGGKTSTARATGTPSAQPGSSGRNGPGAPDTSGSLAQPAAETSEPRCGAPANPFGYGFCGGDKIREPARELCDHFDCVPGFWEGRGYLVECGNGKVSLAGGSSRACGQHGGVRRVVLA
ncbi:hypothetical protein [Micromonospora endophytica]|uniref:Uncharacterized protein n=1 Tax=Micromonospora endophytica TaxID=515350 RepID=A0A2W2BG56_9ACTN|nr:hypothetical protein [Micromonospora endophytica]PZF86175.1 hypothetical protein C1I93_28035 [Micromonospora endophytica]RIW50941.1 hypothetical protein D3H59_01795 [Micromonospora endophytica]BCJ58349.1 hypothetical protein Jiend_17710 [Micromonospora endophytica]